MNEQEPETPEPEIINDPIAEFGKGGVVGAIFRVAAEELYRRRITPTDAETSESEEPTE